MPSLRLNDQEARDIVSYLMTFRDDRTFEEKKLALGSPELIKKGDKLIREYGCAGCHAIKGMEKESRVSVALSNFGRKRVDELDFGDSKIPHTWDDWFFGKIKDSRQYMTERIASKMPVFALADSEIVVLRTLVRGFVKEIPEAPYQQKVDQRVQATEAGRVMTQYYNCINCHQIEEIGGYVKAVLEDEAMAPPYLFPEGAKVQEQWLHGFLKAPAPIRPWLNLRMPTFQLTDAEITTITKYFLALHGKDLDIRDYQSEPIDQKYAAVGKTLFTDLQCLSCHYTGTIPEGKEAGDLAPNLAMANTRLKPEWIAAWIGMPDSIQPGTRMPSFFPDLNEKSPYAEDFQGDAREQIKALRDYVNSIGRKK
jgi:mono/diheme cytochrome c family protein